MSYTVTLSGVDYSVDFTTVDYTVTLSQVGQQGVTGADWQGAWVTSTDFTVNDVVSNNGSSYICIQAHTSSSSDEPGVGVDTATYWELLAQAGVDGTDGDGFTGGSYDSGTGVVTFTSDDGLGFSTGDLRGVDGTDGDGFTGGSYNASTGEVTFTSDDGLGFSTGDLRGADGDGFTGGSYDASTGVVTFTSDDGLGFTTSDLRGTDGISFIWGSSWTTSTAFQVNDVVENDGSSYICILDHTSSASDEPGVGASAATYWDLMAQKGADGAGSGTVTSIDITGGTGIDSSGGPVTSSGAITVALDAATIASLDLADSALQSINGTTDEVVITGGDTISLATAVTSSLALADSAQQPPSEGPFVDGDKTKLDNIETGADVTDTDNVQAAGALMDSEVTNLADVKAFDPADYVTQTAATGAAELPVGTEAQRPTGAKGLLRFNDDAGEFEGHDGSAWGAIGGAGTPGTPSVVKATSTSTMNVNVTSFTAIPFDEAGFTSGSQVTHHTVTNNTRFVAVSDGIYRLTFNARVSSANQRPAPQIAIRKNGNTIMPDDLVSHTYIRGATGHTHSTVNISALFELTAGDYIEVGGNKQDGDTGSVTLTGETSCTVERFEVGEKGEKGDTGPAGSMDPDVHDTLTAGFDSDEEALGTISSGTVTPEVDAANKENFKTLTNNGAFTLAPPSTSSACTIRIHVTNAASAGAITTSGFDKVFDPDSYATDNAKEYFFYIDHTATRDVLTIREIV